MIVLLLAIGGGVQLKDGKFPEVFLDGTWSPICGHHVWDTDFGAQLFCQKLFSNNASTGHVVRSDKALEKNAIRIGKCLSNDTWLSCSGGCNDRLTGQGCNSGDNCGANSPASIEIKCSQGKAGKCQKYVFQKYGGLSQWLSLSITTLVSYFNIFLYHYQILV